ncbi:MAG: cache domain-containing protein [Candidatus Marinarcus sp.]|uniref:cache domain-containing protein n=1 Tax=Candidatus Marinarcus sp. TaxID=3100987 RepID=UPI003B005717
MSTLNSKSNRYLLTIIVITSFFIALIFYILIKTNHSDNLLNNLENSLSTTKNLFEEQKRYALSLSILLSQDKEILNSYLHKNREESFAIVNQKIEALKQLQNSNFEVQIHNQDLTTYLRSWDLSKKGIALASFRQGLVKVKEEKKPLVSIELGKRLNIKAISPLLQNGVFIGSIETIIDFEHLSKELEQKGYTLFVLLNQKYLNIATRLQNNPKYLEYVLVNKADFKNFENIPLKELKEYGYVSNTNYSFSYFSYYDLNNNPLGYIFTGIKNAKHIKINNAYEDEQNTQHLHKVTIE